MPPKTGESLLAIHVFVAIGKYIADMKYATAHRDEFCKNGSGQD